MPRATTLALALLALAALSRPARAEIQVKGPQVYPGKSEVSVHVGYQGGLVGWNGGGAPSGFRLLADYNFRFYDFGGTTLWLNAGAALTVGGACGNIANAAGAYCGGLATGDSVEPMVGLKAKFRTPIPLVPYARLDAFFSYIFNRHCDDNGYGFGARAAGGAKYFLTRNVGIGIEAGVTLGPAIFPAGAPYGNKCPIYNYPAHTDFYGAIDILAGAEFAFNRL